MVKIAVTGLGSINPLGNNFATTWDNLCAGKTAVQVLPTNLSDLNNFTKRFPTTDPDPQAGSNTNLNSLSSFLGAPVKADLSKFLTSKQQQRNDRATQFALIAAADAITHAAGQSLSTCPNSTPYWRFIDQAIAEVFQTCPSRRLVSYSPGLGNIHTIISAWEQIITGGVRKVSPLTVPMLMPNAATATLAVLLKAQGGAQAPVSACASGAEAIVHAAKEISAGNIDVALVGGGDAGIHPLSLVAFSRLRALSQRIDDPSTASRPFSASRDGFVLGEGAACLVLESEDHALTRNAKILAYLEGWGLTCDAFDIAPPDPSGLPQQLSMEIALEAAGLTAAEIVHVNPHATSTPAGDAIEGRLISELFPTALVSATKAATGHLLGGAGALEAAFTVAAVHQQFAPPTCNVIDFHEFDFHLVGKTGCPFPSSSLKSLQSKDLSTNLGSTSPAKISCGSQAALSNSFGFGGHNCALIFCPA